MYGELALFSGTANRPLAEAVADYLGIELSEADVFQFPNTNTFCRLHESVRGKDVFLIQPTSPPTNDNLMELLVFLDTLRRDSAARITAVIPYYGYGRSDKKDQPRVPITGRLVADLITVAGANRVLTFDLHAGQIQGFFTIPVDELTATPILLEHIRNQEIPNLVVVAPDIGAVRRSRLFAEQLGVPLAIIEKRRSLEGDKTTIYNLIGDVKGANTLLVDDEIDTAGTITSAASFLLEQGAKDVFASATHPIFSPPAPERLDQSPISKIYVTNTVLVADHVREMLGDRLEILNVGDLLGEVIRRIHVGISVGALFNE
ncbi:MAG: ribose-phosphate pyrophosphokinase [Chloroflexi bacterium]|nr:ribose-phosphate pyrophosphokinase [Chloroflexota bacterium]